MILDTRWIGLGWTPWEGSEAGRTATCFAPFFLLHPSAPRWLAQPGDLPRKPHRLSRQPASARSLAKPPPKLQLRRRVAKGRSAPSTRTTTRRTTTDPVAGSIPRQRSRSRAPTAQTRTSSRTSPPPPLVHLATLRLQDRWLSAMTTASPTWTTFGIRAIFLLTDIRDGKLRWINSSMECTGARCTMWWGRRWTWGECCWSGRG